MALWKSQDDDDDFFGGQDEGTGQRRCEDGHELHSGLAVAESAATAQRFRNLGYHESYDESKEVNLQKGFEEGYRNSFGVSMRIGQLLGNAAMEAALSIQNPSSGNNCVTEEQQDPIHIQAARLVRQHLTKTEEAPSDGNGEMNDLEKLESELNSLVHHVSSGTAS